MQALSQRVYYKLFDEKDGLPSTRIDDIVQDDIGFLWFSSGNRAWKFDGQEFVDFDLGGKGYQFVNKDYFGRIWFYGMVKRLMYCEEGRLYEYPYNHIVASYKGARIKSIYVDKEKSLWIGFMSGFTTNLPCYIKIDTLGTVTEMDRADGTSNWFVKELGDTFIQSTKQGKRLGVDSFDVCVERTSGMNAYTVPGFIEMQLYRIQDEYHLFSRYQGAVTLSKNKNPFDGYKGLRFQDIYLNRDGQLFMPQEIGSAHCFDLSKTEEEPKIFLPLAQISAIFQSKDGGHWFGTVSGELYYVPSLNAKVYDVEMGLPHGRIVASQVLSNHLWVAYKEGVLSKVSLNNATIENYEFKALFQSLHLYPLHKKMTVGGPYELSIPEAFPYELSFQGSIRTAYPISQNEIYFLGGKAIHEWSLPRNKLLKTHRLDEKAQAVCRISPENYLFSGKEGLYSIHNGEVLPLYEAHEALANRISHIMALGDSWYAMSSATHGLLLVKYDGSIQICYPHQVEKPRAVRRIVVEPGNFLWIVYSDGLERMSFKPHSDYVHLEKVQTVDYGDGFPHGAFNTMLVDSNNIWLTSTKAVYQLPKYSHRSEVKPNKVSVTSFYHGRDTVQFMNDMSLMSTSATTKIHFSSPDFAYPEGLSFEYRLNGYETEWSTSTKRYVTYEALPPGQFELELRARSANGPPGEATSFGFSIAPQYWQTTWFKVGGVAVGAVLLGLFGYLRMQRIRQRKRLLTEIKSYRNKSLRLQMNPHFMYNTLGSIQSYVLQEESRLSSKYISKFSRLMRLIFEHNTKELITLAEELEALKLYVELESIRRQDHLDFELDTASSVDTERTLIPPMLLQPLVENSIQHGLTGRAKSLISVRIALENGGLQFSIRDNGSWNKGEAKMKKRVSGGVITFDRIALFNQQRRYKGAMDTKQLDGLGTQVTFSIAHITTD